MQTIKREVIEIFDSKNRKVNVGDAVMVFASGRPNLGIFAGVGSRGSWEFVGIAEYADKKFAIAPRSIDSMYLFDLGV